MTQIPIVYFNFTSGSCASCFTKEVIIKAFQTIVGNTALFEVLLIVISKIQIIAQLNLCTSFFLLLKMTYFQSVFQLILSALNQNIISIYKKLLKMIEIEDKQCSGCAPIDPTFVAQFPTTIKVGKRFASKEQVISTLEAECSQRKLPPFKDLFEVRYKPDGKQDWQIMKIKCKWCVAGLHISRSKGTTAKPFLVVKRMLNEHNHELEKEFIMCSKEVVIELDTPKNASKPKKKQKNPEKQKGLQKPATKKSKSKQPKTVNKLKEMKQIQLSPEPKNRKNEIPAEPINTKPVELFQPIQFAEPEFSPPKKALSKKQKSPLKTKCPELLPNDNFKSVQSMMFKHEVQFLIDWGNIPKDRYPEVMVIATPAMIANYRKFGQTVSFDITNDLVSNTSANDEQYRLGTFVIQDSSLKSQLVAIVLFCNEEVLTFYSIFDLFFKLIGEAPSSIMTSENVKICKALGILRTKKIFKGYHFFDAWHILANLNKTILGDRQHQSMLFNGFAKLIKLRDSIEYQRTADSLVEKSGINRQFVEVFLEKADRICFTRVPNTFVGIDNWKCNKISDLIGTNDTNIPICKLIEVLIKNSEQFKEAPFKIYSQKAEQYLLDKRFKQVRLRVHQKVFMRLMENYIIALSTCQISEQLKDKETGLMGFYVKRRNSSAPSYDILDWKCSCNEMEKSGIACPHLLICAQATKEKSLLQLVAKRWIHDPPPNEKPKLKGSVTSVVEVEKNS